MTYRKNTAPNKRSTSGQRCSERDSEPLLAIADGSNEVTEDIFLYRFIQSRHMPSKRLSVGDLKQIIASQGVPLGRDMIADNIEAEWTEDRYGKRVGEPYAVWSHTSDGKPVTITSFFEGLIEYMEAFARDDPQYFYTRAATLKGLSILRAGIIRHAARNRQAKLLQAVDAMIRKAGS